MPNNAETQLSAVLQEAMAHHQAGRLDLAERLYRQVLAEVPDHAETLHLVGVLARQRGRFAEAIARMKQALTLRPDMAGCHSNLSDVYRMTGDLVQAEAHARTALRLQPEHGEAYNNLGLALQLQGRVEEAQQQLETALRLRPFVPQAYINLADLLVERGALAEAAALLQEGLRLIPDSPALQAWLGRVLLDQGNTNEALRLCREAVHSRPSDPEVLGRAAFVLASTGRVGDARAIVGRALEVAPRHSAAYHVLGRLAHIEGSLDEALVYYEQAAQFDPAAAQVRCDWATALHESERSGEALARCREAVAIRPGSYQAHQLLGLLLQSQGDLPGAIAAMQEALRLCADSADVHAHLGLMLTESGDMEAAEAAFRSALQHDPDHAEALAALALAKRDQLPVEDLQHIERLLASETISGRPRAVLQYGAAQAFDALSRYDEAARHVSEANRYLRETDQRRGRAYDPQEHHAYVDQLIRAFDKSHFSRVRGWGVDDDLPVFVLGLPRSGTSLIEQILASHPKVFGAGELDRMRDAYRAIPGLVGKYAPGVACVSLLDRAAVQTLADGYLAAIRALHPTAARIVDKMPDNYLMLGLIATLLPRARVIHVRRDLRDVAVSCWMTYFRNIRWACDLEHIAGRLRDYQRLMEHWERVLPLPILHVDYEETVSDLEGVVRRLLDWCGLEWDPACLTFFQTPRPVRTASMVQVRAPVYAHSVGRWKHYDALLGSLSNWLPPSQ